MKDLNKLILAIMVIVICIGNPNSAQAEKVDELIITLKDRNKGGNAAKQLGELGDPCDVAPLPITSPCKD